MTAMAIVLSNACDNDDMAVVIGVLQQLLAKDRELTARRQRYYGDSLHHRLKNRILQAVLIFEAVLAKSSNVKAQVCCYFYFVIISYICFKCMYYLTLIVDQYSKKLHLIVPKYYFRNNLQILYED